MGLECESISASLHRTTAGVFPCFANARKYDFYVLFKTDEFKRTAIDDEPSGPNEARQKQNYACGR